MMINTKPMTRKIEKYLPMAMNHCGNKPDHVDKVSIAIRLSTPAVSVAEDDQQGATALRETREHHAEVQSCYSNTLTYLKTTFKFNVFQIVATEGGAHELATTLTHRTASRCCRGPVSQCAANTKGEIVPKISITLKTFPINNP